MTRRDPPAPEGARRLSDARWIGLPPSVVTECFPPTFDDRPFIARGLEPVIRLRKTFRLPAEVSAGTLYITARGLYRTVINGTRVGTFELAPGWTDYHRRIAYQTYDVGELLSGDDLVWDIVLADGWYAGYLGMDRKHQAGLYGGRSSALAALILRHRTGETTVVTDSSWTARPDRIRYSDLLMGEMVDLTFDGGIEDPLPVHEEDPDPGVSLDPERGPGVTTTAVLPARSVTALNDGRQIVDFGQNLVGRVRIDVSGVQAGTWLHLRHGEVLDAAGALYTENLRTARAHDIVVCDGSDTVVEPVFTIHGFRYVEVSGHPGGLTPAHLQAAVIGSDVPVVGTFDCSDPAVTALHRNIEWTVRGNLVSVATDCPQRDERLGWLGDAGVIMNTAAYLYDLSGFLEKWLQDIRDGQSADGAYSDVAPKIVITTGDAPGWADAGVLIPWRAYVHGAPLSLLADHYDSMSRYMAHLSAVNPGHFRENSLGRNYGDWLHLCEGPGPSKVLLATAYWKLDADMMAHAAAALGRDGDAAAYRRMASEIASAFSREFVDENGVLTDPTQTGHALALYCRLIPEAHRAAAGRRLVADIAARGGLTTGIHGTRVVLPVLADLGHSDVAHAVLAKRSAPSWLYAVEHGATTIWERWDGISPGGSMQTPAMNSLNHYALGSVGEWLHRYLGGLRPDDRRPGYRHLRVRPYPGGTIDAATVTRKTATGPVRVGWQSTGGMIRLTVDVPAGSTGEIHIPTTDLASVEVAAGQGERAGPAGAWAGFLVGDGRFCATAAWDRSWRPDADPHPIG